MKRLAMARPDIGFVVEHDGRRVLAVQPTSARPERVAALTSYELIDNSVALDFEREGVRLGGVASLPTYNRGVADHQFLFVNGRPVKDRLLIGAVRGAYAEMLARDRHAVVALFLDLPPTLVDVNVHPAKTEVRFRDPALIRGMIVSGLREFLAGLQISVPVSKLAKWKTTFQLVSLGGIILAGALPDWMLLKQVALALLWIAAVLTMITGWDYLRVGIKHMD
jgi:DNA mismatch repair ATPase MutL